MWFSTRNWLLGDDTSPIGNKETAQWHQTSVGKMSLRMPRIGHAGSFMLVTFRRENFPFFLKRNHHRIALKSISFCFWSGQTKIFQPKIKSLNHLPSKIMCRIPRMDFPCTPRHGIPQHETPVFSLFHSFNASQDPERIGKNTEQLGSVHYWFVQTFVEVSGTDQFLTKKYQLRLQPFEKVRSKKTRIFHKIITTHEAWSFKPPFAHFIHQGKK